MILLSKREMKRLISILSRLMKLFFLKDASHVDIINSYYTNTIDPFSLIIIILENKKIFVCF